MYAIHSISTDELDHVFKDGAENNQYFFPSDPLVYVFVKTIWACVPAVYFFGDCI